MSKVSRALEPSKKTRVYLLERDSGSCIYKGCTRQFGIAPAHIFFPRSKGGLGVKENLVLLCQHHHHILDNGVDSKLANEIEQYCKEYLRSKHEFNVKDLKYNKWKGFKHED